MVFRRFVKVSVLASNVVTAATNWKSRVNGKRWVDGKRGIVGRGG